MRNNRRTIKQIRKRMSVAAAVIVLLTGCQRSEVQRIETLAHKTEAEPVEIVIEQETEEKTEIIIEQTEQEEQEPAAEPLTLLFSGDVLLSDHVLNAYQKAGGVHGVVDDGYRQSISDADFFMVNQEFPFSSRGTQAPDKQYTFRLPPEKVSIFTELGIDAVTLANNHALDFGQDALLDSCQVLDDAGILHTGAGADLEAAKKPVSFTWNGQDIAIIGATRVIPVADWAAGKNHPGMLATYDATVLVEEIRRLSETQDYVIVFVHW